MTLMTAPFHLPYPSNSLRQCMAYDPDSINLNLAVDSQQPLGMIRNTYAEGVIAAGLLGAHLLPSPSRRITLSKK
jgi:hypothetical protein